MDWAVCVVQMNGQVKVNATFKPTVQCTQPSCWTRDAVASDTVGLKLLNAIWGTSADNIWASSQFGSFITMMEILGVQYSLRILR